MTIKLGSKLLKTFNEYTLVKQLGQGGAQTVFEAKASDGTAVAIKLLRGGISVEKTKRFNVTVQRDSTA